MPKNQRVRFRARRRGHGRAPAFRGRGRRRTAGRSLVARFRRAGAEPAADRDFRRQPSSYYRWLVTAMHILFLTDNFPPETNAPASRTYEHTRRWVEAGHQVTVLTCAPNFPKGEVYPGYRNAWQIGRASCRERVEVVVGAVSLTKEAQAYR